MAAITCALRLATQRTVSGAGSGPAGGVPPPGCIAFAALLVRLQVTRGSFAQIGKRAVTMWPAGARLAGLRGLDRRALGPGDRSAHLRLERARSFRSRRRASARNDRVEGGVELGA